MLVMIPFTLDEVVAMGQYMLWSVRQGRSFWRTSFQGGPEPSGDTDKTDPGFSGSLSAQTSAAVRGLTVPWRLLASCIIGVWLMFSRLVGAMVVTVAVCAMAEVARPMRFFNLLFGLWLVGAPWLIGGAATAATLNDVVAGLAVIGLSLSHGRISRETMDHGAATLCNVERMW